MSDINSLIKSGAIPSATPRTSKVSVPEVIITEDIQTTGDIQQDLVPDEIAETKEDRMSLKKEDDEHSVSSSETKDEQETQDKTLAEEEDIHSVEKAEIHQDKTDEESEDGQSLKFETNELEPEVQSLEPETQSLKSQSKSLKSERQEHDSESERGETTSLKSHDSSLRERSASVLPEEADEIKSLKSERSIVERSLSMSSLQSQQRQQQHHDTAVLEEESENHPSVAELLASAKLSRKNEAAPSQAEIESEVESEYEPKSEVESEFEPESEPEAVDERDASNQEVLTKMAEEAANDEEQLSEVSKLLIWAKSTRKSKTETMKVREKKRVDIFKRAVDVNAVPIIIENKKKEDTVSFVHGHSKTFKLTSATTIGSRQDFLGKFEAETKMENVITKSWIEKAVIAHEDVTGGVTIVSLAISRHESGHHEAKIIAKVGDGPDSERTYNWLIKKSVSKSANTDKESYITADLGPKLAKYAKKNSKTLRKDATYNFPLQYLIFADNNFSAYDQLKGYRAVTDEGGLNLDCLKLALKALARLHATSYAHFKNNGKDATTNKIFGQHNFQTADAKEKAEIKDGLDNSFENLMEVIKGLGPDGLALAVKARSKFENRLYDIFKDALQPNSNFSVLCHGFPVQADFLFRFEGEGANQKPVDVKIVNFGKAKFAHAITDVLSLMQTEMGPQVEEQAGFLLRFVYFETLASHLKSFGFENLIDFDSLKKEYKNKDAYGALAGAMHLAEFSGQGKLRTQMTANRASGKRSFTSKLLGSYSSASKETHDPVLVCNHVTRARALIEKIVSDN